MQFKSGAHIASRATSVHRRGNHHRRSRRNRHFRDGVMRAYTAAQLVHDKLLPTPTMAAIACGACPQYVAAVCAILRSGDRELLVRVLSGQVPLLAAARQVKRLTTLVTAYTTADFATRVEFGRKVGTATLWDSSISPLL